MAVSFDTSEHPGPGAGATHPRRVHRVLGSPGLRLAGRRLLAAVPVLFGVTLLTYVVMNLLRATRPRYCSAPTRRPPRSTSCRSSCT